MKAAGECTNAPLETQERSPADRRTPLGEFWQEICSVDVPLRLRVRGTSMIPALWPGEMITVRPVGFDALAVGDIVVFARDGQLVAHRLQCIMEEGDDDSQSLRLATRGDTSVDADDPVHAAELVGRVSSVQRFGSQRRRPVHVSPIASWTIARVS